jgi:hypothetical protein
MNAYELADGMETLAQVNANIDEQIRGCMMDSATMLRQQADRIAELEKVSSKPVAWWTGKFDDECEDFMFSDTRQSHIDHPQSETHNFFPIPLYTHPHKELSDEIFNKAFDFYCETDEGVLRFDFELREEWKHEQLKRWKEAIIKASRGEE